MRLSVWIGIGGAGGGGRGGGALSSARAREEADWWDGREEGRDVGRGGGDGGHTTWNLKQFNCSLLSCAFMYFKL